MTETPKNRAELVRAFTVAIYQAHKHGASVPADYEGETIDPVILNAWLPVGESVASTLSAAGLAVVPTEPTPRMQRASAVVPFNGVPLWATLADAKLDARATDAAYCAMIDVGDLLRDGETK